MSWLAVAVATLAVALPQSAPPKPAAPFAPTQLLDLPFPIDARLGIALARAARGEFEAGATAVAELATERDPTLTPERLDRESARLAALAKARREFFERCVAEKKKFKIEQDGKPVAGTVAEVGADRFVLVDGRGKRQEVALAALGADSLLKRMSDLKLEDGSPTTRAYAALLAGRKSWAKVIDGASDPEAAALRGDAPEYAAMLATGEAGCALQELAAAPLPAAGPAAEATIAAIKALLADHDREAIVIARRDLLRQLAAHALGRRFDAKGIVAAGLKGDVHPLPEGAVRLTYEFKDPAELADFAVSTSKHPSWYLFKIELPAADWKHTLADETLQMIGQGCLRHRVEFEAPVSAAFEVVYAGINEALSPYASLRVSLCDNSKGSMVTNLDLMSVDLYDAAKRSRTTSDPDGKAPDQVDPESPYSVRLEHDGKNAKLRVAQQSPQELPAASRLLGGVAIYWKADAPVTLLRFVIEGRVAPDGLASLRDAAVAREVAAFFGE